MFMLTLSSAAQEKIVAMQKQNEQEGFAVRLRITGRDAENFQYEFRSVEVETRRVDDIVVVTESFEVFVDPESASHLEGVVIDFGGLGAGGFKIDNPNPVWTEDIAREVADIIAKEINPGIALHSGSVTLVDVKDNIVYVRLNGGCQGCGAATITLKLGIERRIKEAIPKIESVIDLTDHDAGASPYYTDDQAGQSPLACDT